MPVVYGRNLVPKIEAKIMLSIDQNRNEYIVGFRGVRKLNIEIKAEVEMQILNILDQPISKLVLNLQGIVFIDSAGFELLMEIEQKADLKDVKLQLMNVSDEAHEIFDLLKMEKVFEIV